MTIKNVPRHRSMSLGGCQKSSLVENIQVIFGGPLLPGFSVKAMGTVKDTLTLMKGS